MKTLRLRNQTLAEVLRRVKTPPAKLIPTEVVPLASLPEQVILKAMKGRVRRPKGVPKRTK
jgi:hypothetical protein